MPATDKQITMDEEPTEKGRLQRVVKVFKDNLEPSTIPNSTRSGWLAKCGFLLPSLLSAPPPSLVSFPAQMQTSNEFLSPHTVLI